MKRISTKLAVAMAILAVAVLTFTGIVLMISISIDYHRSFYSDVYSVLKADLPDTVTVSSLDHFITKNRDALMKGSDKSCYILKDGGVVKSYSQGGSLEKSANLTALRGGRACEEVRLFSKVLDYGIDAGGGYAIYITDTKTQLFSQMRKISWQLIQALALGVLLAVIISWMLSKRLTRSIKTLEKGAKRMADGDFSAITLDSDDEIGALCGVLNRMGEQIQHDYDEFEKEEARRREFVANVSHELKTPLTVIKSYSQTLSENAVDADTQKQFLAVIDSEVDRMSDTVSQLLELSRLETKQAGDITDIDLLSLCRGITDSLAMEVRAKELDVRLCGNGGIRSDVSRVRTMLTNIIANAVKYTEPGGSIDIVISGSTLTVTDSGIGISKEDLPHIFDRFYRADKARGRKTGGTGLGLAIAKECADAIGADISADSRLGEYTRFEVRFNG